MSQRIGAAFHKFCLWSRAPVRVGPLRARQKRTYSTSPHSPTVLEKLISDTIKANGPISVSEYTQFCLSHPTDGYYMKQRSDGTDVFGARGDFITSPEISQVFGELVGIWLLSQWLHTSNGAPPKSKIRLVELGPGRGTLMDDILRTFFNWPQAKAALSTVHLVETSPTMSSRQQEKLSHWFHSTGNVQLHTCTSLDDVPLGSNDEFTMVVAHEFFDALPAHILEKTSDGFREVLVDLHHPPANASGVSNATVNIPSSPFRFVLSPTATPRSALLGALSPRFALLPQGTRLEVSSAGWRTARTMGKLISSTIVTKGESDLNVEKSNGTNGAALIIDYGDDHAFSSSFRAFKSHRLVDVFETPGMCDLTTNVDFALLKEGFNGIVTTHGPLQQSEFLLRMGIRERLAALIRQAPNDDRRREIDQAGRKLIDRSGHGMGAIYRVLGVTSPPQCDGPKDVVWPFVDGSR